MSVSEHILEELKLSFIGQKLFEITIESNTDYDFIVLKPSKEVLMTYLSQPNDLDNESLLQCIIYPSRDIVDKIFEDKPLFINYLNRELLIIGRQEISDDRATVKVIDNLRFINSQKFPGRLISGLFSNTDGDIKIIADSFISLFGVEETPLNKLACLVIADMYAALNHLRIAFSDDGRGKK